MAKGDWHCYKCGLEWTVAEFGSTSAAHGKFNSHIASKEHKAKAGPITRHAQEARDRRAEARARKKSAKERNVRRNTARLQDTAEPLEDLSGRSRTLRPAGRKAARVDDPEDQDKRVDQVPDQDQNEDDDEQEERASQTSVGEPEVSGGAAIPFPGPGGEEIPERLADVEHKQPAQKAAPTTGARGGIVLDEQGLHFRIAGLLVNSRVMLLFEWARDKWPEKYGSNNFEAAMSEFLCDATESLFISEGIAPVIYRQALGLSYNNGRLQVSDSSNGNGHRNGSVVPARS